MTNKAKLTKSYVDRCEGDGFHWDTALSGFGLRISGTTKTYIVQGRINGQDKRRSIERHGVVTTEQARQLARKALHEMHSGIDPKDAARARKVEGVTLAEVFADYLARGGLKDRTLYDYRGYMARYFASWQGKPIAAITADMVEKKHAQIKTEHGGAQANVSMRFLRALFNFASGKYQRVNGDPLIAISPTKRLSSARLWATVERRTGYIKVNELERWHQAVMRLGTNGVDSNAETVRDYLLLLLFTGLRRQEAMALRWEHVDFDDRSVTIPKENTKNSQEHALPLTSYLYELLKERHGSRVNGFVFPGRGKTGHLVAPTKLISKIVDDSGIKFSPHDLRRTFATCASTVIDNQSTVKRLMNHMTGSQDVTEGYKQGVERLRKPAQFVTDYILRHIDNLQAS